MTDATIGLVGTLVGTVLGFVLAEAAAWFRSTRAETARKRVIKGALAAEIEFNIEYLLFYTVMLKDAPPKLDEDTIRGFIERELRWWSGDIWRSQLPSLPDVLTKQELSDVTTFYARLVQLDNIIRRKAPGGLTAEDFYKDILYQVSRTLDIAKDFTFVHTTYLEEIKRMPK